MNQNPKYKKITCIILIITAISLILTGLIVNSLIKKANSNLSKHWFFEQSITTGQPVLLKDAFILSNADGKLLFLYDYKTYEVDGNLPETYFGVANIQVDGTKISKISIKPEMIEDVLVSYTENTLSLKNETHSELIRNENLPIYKIKEEQVTQAEWNELIIGVSKISCIMDNGEVSAILIKEEVTPSDIRVLIKNGNSIFYPELYVYQAATGTLVDVNAALAANATNILEISDAQGLLLCDSVGQALESAYEGIFRIIKTEQGLVLVNEVPMETYLKYVIPSEMQINFGHEALKAQAVCARTFAYSQMKNQSYAMYGANLDDSTSFQVYHNNTRYPETDAAVDETVGEIISCNGQLITCYYCSTSPGVTNDMSSWENTNPAYIAMNGFEKINNLNLQNTVDFSNYMNLDCESFDKSSPYYRWKAVLDLSEIKENSYGKLKNMEIKERNAAGFVTNLELTYENDVVNYKNENTIRNILGNYLMEIILNDESIRTGMSMIPSACFEIVELSEEKAVLRGGGFGHGIGMSQYGAKAMAEAGYTYKDIINYYYANVVVKTLE